VAPAQLLRLLARPFRGATKLRGSYTVHQGALVAAGAARDPVRLLWCPGITFTRKLEKKKAPMGPHFTWMESTTDLMALERERERESNASSYLHMYWQ